MEAEERELEDGEVCDHVKRCGVVSRVRSCLHYYERGEWNLA